MCYFPIHEQDDENDARRKRKSNDERNEEHEVTHVFLFKILLLIHPTKKTTT